LHELAWTSPRFGYENKLFLVTARTRSIWGWVVLGLQEIDPSDHGWTPSTDERPLDFAPVVTNRPAPQEVSGFFVEPAIAMDSEGRGRRPAVDVFWSAASVTTDVDFVRITHYLSGETTALWTGLIPRPQLLEGSARVIEALMPNEAFDFEIQYIPGSGRPTVSSGRLSVTTPNVKLGPLDVIFGDINLDELGTQFDGLLDWIAGNVRDLIEQSQAQAVLTGDQELANAMQFDELRRSLSVAVGDLSATFEETITTAIIPMNGLLVAIADALTELSAGDGADVSTARFRMTAQTGPEGGVTIGMQGRTGTEGAWRDAGAFLNVPNDPGADASFLVLADKFAVRTTGNDAIIPFSVSGETIAINAVMIGPSLVINPFTGFFSFG
jgi:hypothetical protein